MLYTCNNYSNSLASISRVLFYKNLQWPGKTNQCKKKTTLHYYASKNLLRDITFWNETVGTPRWYICYCQEFHKTWQLLRGQRITIIPYIATATHNIHRTISCKEYAGMNESIYLGCWRINTDYFCICLGFKSDTIEHDMHAWYCMFPWPSIEI